MIRTRKFPEHNYYSVWCDGHAVRFQIDDDKPITELRYPEFYDVKITGKCSGNCPWCYQDSTEDSEHYPNIVEKAEQFFGIMTPNQRPFQIALGGGNPNEHPDFCNIAKYFDSIGIVPNYTTNGMGITKEIVDITRDVCGGVAISTHPHLIPHWIDALCDLYEGGVKNIATQTIISNKESIDYFVNVYRVCKDLVKYIVLLPYEVQGRAVPANIDYRYLGEVLDRLEDKSKLAFGAGFYEWLKTRDYDVSLYEPELMSKFLDMKDMTLYKSSFNLEMVNYEVL